MLQQLWQQLQLVVLHPHGRAGLGAFDNSLRKTFIDLAVCFPPLFVELGGDDQVVVERPQGGVGKSLVELLEVCLRQGHRVQAQTFELHGGKLVVDGPRPTHPHTIALG